MRSILEHQLGFKNKQISVDSCKRFGLSETRTFAFSLYGQELAVRFAKVVRDRYQYLFILCTVEQDEDYVYDDKDLASIEDDKKLEELVRLCPMSARRDADKRLAELYAGFPRAPRTRISGGSDFSDDRSLPGFPLLPVPRR